MLGNHSLSGLMKWLAHEEWREPFADVLDLHLGPACEDYEMDFEDIAEVIGDHAAMTLWGCAFEDFLTQAVEPDGRNIVEDYLKRRGWKESAGNRRYMEALRDSCMSLYEVSEIVPGQSFLARDLLRGGEPIRVSEHSATKSLKLWDKIGARIVEVSGKNILAGGLLPFRPSAATLLMDELKAARQQARREFRKLTREAQLPRATREDGQIADLLFMATAAPIFSNIWLDDALASALDQSLPTILNSDGDEVVFCRVRFPLRSEGAAAELRERLRTVPAFQEENEGFWNWIEPRSLPNGLLRQAGEQVRPKARPVCAGDARHGRHGPGQHRADRQGVAAGGELPRAGRAWEAILAELAGALVGPALTEIETLEQVMAGRDGDDHLDQASDLPAELQAELVHGALTDHYRTTIDEPIPALEDLSPRAAAQTAAGWRKVADWLKHIENQSKSGRQPDDPMASYDFTWLWRDLGPEKLRR